MPGALEIHEELGRLLREGKIPSDERMPPLYFPRLAARKKVKNTEGRTRLIKEMDTPATYSEFVKQFDRYISITGNPQVAYHLMLQVLGALSDDSIKRMAEEG